MDIFLGKVDRVFLGKLAWKSLTTVIGDAAGYELCHKVNICRSHLEEHN